MTAESEIEELARWFEAAAICHGYAIDTNKGELADKVVVDIDKMFKRAHELGSEAENRLAAFMNVGNRPWVRYHAAVGMVKTHRHQAINTLRQLKSETGLFVPLCVALVADFERPLNS